MLSGLLLLTKKGAVIFTIIKEAIKKLPILSKIISEREELRSELSRLVSERDKLNHELVFLNKNLGFCPPGHFYSPIPSLEDIQREETSIFGNVPTNILGLDMLEEGQLELLKGFVEYYNVMPFKSDKLKGYRYYYENPAYSYSDAILLHCMIRYLKPHRIIEVGSGYSSCMTLDTNELNFGDSIKTTFIEPYPELLMSLIKETDKSKITVIPDRLQDVDLGLFEELQANDILFIDSTHVSKINSDVNRIFFEILPRLSEGVHIHFHDIFFPFEYPKAWVYEGRAWNEAYLLKAFLQYNTDFTIVLMNTYMSYFHQDFFEKNMPLCLNNTGGSVWVRKI
jgi:hypothetical protein